MATKARATAARHDLTPPRTWDKKVHSVKAGVQKAWAVWPKETCSSAKAWSMSSALRTSAKGRPSAWRNGARVLWNGEAAGRGVEKDMGAFLAKRQAAPRKASHGATLGREGLPARGGQLLEARNPTASKENGTVPVRAPTESLRHRQRTEASRP